VLGCVLQVFRKRKDRLPVDEHDLVSGSSSSTS
jgi:hypothetical protein